MIRNKETQETDRLEAEGADYDEARGKLQAALPEGWQTLAIWTDRWHEQKTV